MLMQNSDHADEFGYILSNFNNPLQKVKATVSYSLIAVWVVGLESQCIVAQQMIG